MRSNDIRLNESMVEICHSIEASSSKSINKVQVDQVDG